MPYFVYVLYSPQFKKLYKGQTQDLQNRLKQHNLGHVRSTKAYIPWKIVYFEGFRNRQEAVDREHYLKTASGRRFIKTTIHLTD